MPLRHRHGYAAVLHRGLPTGETNPIQEFPARHEGPVRAAIQPVSTGFELVKVLRGFTPLVPRVHLPVSLAGHAPSGSTSASRRCQGCSPSAPAVSPEPTAPSSYRFAATKRRQGSCTLARSHGASWRTAPLLHRISPRSEEVRPRSRGYGVIRSVPGAATNSHQPGAPSPCRDTMVPGTAGTASSSGWVIDST